MITLKEARDFHGHLGPYLVLGILAGELAAKKIRYKKHFGIEVVVRGATKKPKSCLIDGLQLSTGATYGKGNIKKISGPDIKIEFYNKLSNKKIIFKLHKTIEKKLAVLKGHSDSEAFARELYKSAAVRIGEKIWRLLG